MQLADHISTKHRVSVERAADVVVGEVHWSPVKSIWFVSMAASALIGGIATFTWAAFALFVSSTLFVLLFGHSLGSHRKFIHNSFQCPRWLEYALVYCGLQVGLAGPLGLLRQHELRDFAQRLPHCHEYLRHGAGFWRDAWWQLNCDLHLLNAPRVELESRIADDRFFQFLERTWMFQHAVVAVLFYVWGGWGFVFWGVCARVTAGVFGHWLIGYFAHNHGPMNYEIQGAAVQGHNIGWVSLITMGESWHNNHHAYPGSARLGLAPGEWDPGWWMLRCLEAVGLAWGIRLPDDLAPREELIPLHFNLSPMAAEMFDPNIAPCHNTENTMP
jgi:fatty-acid desaturase